MEISKIKKNDETPRKEKRKYSQQFRVVLNRRANDALEELTIKINSEFEHGEITKSDVANWVLERVKNKINQSEIDEIKEANFDETKALAELLRNSKNDNSSLPPEVIKALKSHIGFSKNRTKKATRKRPEAPLNQNI